MKLKRKQQELEIENQIPKRRVEFAQNVQVNYDKDDIFNTFKEFDAMIK